MDIDPPQLPTDDPSHSPSPALVAAVHAARAELAAVIHALTHVLQTIADSDADKTANGAQPDKHDPSQQPSTTDPQRQRTANNANNNANNVATSAAAPSTDARVKQEHHPHPSVQQQPASSEKPAPPSLQPVVVCLQHLRTSVDAAVRLHDVALSTAKQHEDRVSAAERAALTARRTALVHEVRTKNDKLKLLIDQIRELNRDLLTFRSNSFHYLNRSNPISNPPKG